MDASANEPPFPAARKPRRRLRGLFVGIAIGVVLLAFVARWATTVRQSGVRLKTHVMLHSVAQAAAVYQNMHAVLPASLDDLFTTKLLDPANLDEFSRCSPIGQPLVLDAWLVQTKPCRAVRKGEAWGGPGETIDHDLPACRFVILKDWTIVQIDEPEFQQKYAHRVQLSPLR